MPVPPIKGFLETSFVDWPGKVAAVVFLPRCNFRCPYCHNHGLVLDPERYQSWSLEGVVEHLQQYRNWVDGVCVTGGEPTIHPGLPALLATLRDDGWGVKLDTNGSDPEMVQHLLAAGLLDAVAVDVKAPFDELSYRRNSGWSGSPSQVEETLRRLRRSGVALQVRTTVHPFLLSQPELVRLAAELGELFQQEDAAAALPPYQLQRCRVDEVLDPTLAEREPLAAEEFDQWQRAALQAYHDAGKS